MRYGFAEPRHLELMVPLLALIIAGFALKWFLSRRFEQFFEGQDVSIAGLSPGRSWIKGMLLAASFVGMVVASSGPFVWSRLLAPSFMALVDISQSMWCEDQPDNGKISSRLSSSKSALLSLLDGLPDESRFGLAVFAGREDPVLVVTAPLQVRGERDDLKSLVASIDYHWTWEDGTNIKTALTHFGKIMEAKGGDYGKGLTLVVLTDGEDNADFLTRERNPEPQKLKSNHVIFAGFGSTEGTPVPEFDADWKFKQYRKKYDGTTVLSRLDEKNLRELARLLNGSYIRIRGTSDLNAMLQGGSLNSVEYESKMDVSWAMWLGSFVLLVCSIMI